MTQEAASGTELPEYVTRALTDYACARSDYDVQPDDGTADVDRTFTAACAAVLKYAAEQKRIGRAEVKDWLDTMSEPEGRGSGPNV